MSFCYGGDILIHYFSTHEMCGTKSVKCLVCLNINKVTHLYGKILQSKQGGVYRSYQGLKDRHDQTDKGDFWERSPNAELCSIFSLQDRTKVYFTTWQRTLRVVKVRV